MKLIPSFQLYLMWYFSNNKTFESMRILDDDFDYPFDILHDDVFSFLVKQEMKGVLKINNLSFDTYPKSARYKLLLLEKDKLKNSTSLSLIKKNKFSIKEYLTIEEDYKKNGGKAKILRGLLTRIKIDKQDLSPLIEDISGYVTQFVNEYKIINNGQLSSIKDLYGIKHLNEEWVSWNRHLYGEPTQEEESKKRYIKSLDIFWDENIFFPWILHMHLSGLIQILNIELQPGGEYWVDYSLGEYENNLPRIKLMCTELNKNKRFLIYINDLETPLEMRYFGYSEIIYDIAKNRFFSSEEKKMRLKTVNDYVSYINGDPKFKLRTKFPALTIGKLLKFSDTKNQVRPLDDVVITMKVPQ